MAARLTHVKLRANFQIQVLSSLFYRNKGAYIVGKVMMRLSGIAASIATFAVLAVIIQVYSNWDSVTGAQMSFVGIPIVQSAHASTGTLYGASARFFTKKTAANTFVTYRLN